MSTQKRKTHFFTYILILLSLAFTALVISPYFTFEPGSLASAVIPQLYSIVLSYAGVFRTGVLSFLSPFTLMPALLFLILFTEDSIFSIEPLRRLLHVLFFAGLYFFLEAFQGSQWAFINNLSIYFYYGGAAVAALSFIASLVLQIKELVQVWGGGEKKKKEEVIPQDFENQESEFISEEERRIMAMTDEEALTILESVYVPEFDKYDNFIPDSAILGAGDGDMPNFYSVTSQISNIQRDNRQRRETAEEIKRNREEAKRARLAEIFKVKYMNREEEEDDIFSDNIKIEKEETVDIQMEAPKAAPQYVPPQPQQPQVIYVQQPQPQVIYVQTGNAAPDQVQIPSFQVPPAAPAAPAKEEVQQESFEIEEEIKIEEEPQVETESRTDRIKARFDNLYDSQAMKEEEAELDLSPVNNYSGYRAPEKKNSRVENLTEAPSSVLGLKRAEGQDYLYNSKKIAYKFPPDNLLKHYEQATDNVTDVDVEKDGRIIVDTLRQFKIETKLLDVKHGPTFTLYELSLAKGIRVNTITNLAENIAMDLAVKSVRILAPIPGKTAVGVEVPNKKRYTIGFDMMLSALRKKEFKVPMVLGKTITNDSVVIDLASAPHLLIAGTTGSGKSVCVNSLICSILYTKTPRDVRMLLVDPKMVELTVYNDIPHLLTPVITEPKKAIKAMAYCVQEMERRMNLLSKVGARKIEEYNKKIEEQGFLNAKLPYIVVIIDEFADLMQVVGKELEQYIKRITAVARFTGIHLVLATQRPSVDVITGIIKSNMPTKIAFAVANSSNSRIILDENGAEKLLGRGDMLYASPSSGTQQRIQGAYIDSEVEDIVAFVKEQEKPDYVDEAYFEDEEEEEEENPNGTLSSQDSGEDLFTRAWHLVAEKGEASASYLQRRLNIGYNRAANLIEQLEDAGYIGPAKGGSKPRDVLKYPDSQK
ncbi:MAG: DUF87 domain-containing protein [Sphaerochaetaceae bacterium]|nr:DUF87 domain-containing protein [Sphaerochaetaceae bacterium]